jgi:hypothetical protein
MPIESLKEFKPPQTHQEVVAMYLSFADLFGKKHPMGKTWRRIASRVPKIDSTNQASE